MKLNIEISDEQEKSLEQLRLKTGAASTNELFNSALSTLEWAVREVAAGNEIAAINERDESYRVLNFGPLKAVAAKASASPA